MAQEEAHLTAEVANTSSIGRRRRLPGLVQSLNMKYVKLGYHYMIKHGLYVASVPAWLFVFGVEVGSLNRAELWRRFWDGAAAYNLATVVLLVAVTASAVSVYFSRHRPIFLLDFACYKPNDDFKVTKEQFIELARKSGKFDEASLEFQKRILQTSGIGDESYLPKSIFSPENSATIRNGREEASTVIFGALDELFEKTQIRPEKVGILVVDSGVFNPTPSLSAMIINRYKMEENTLNFNLGGMGSSAGIIALDLARDMLEANPSTFAVVVSTEIVGFGFYQGKERSMLISNCYFRMGCAALMLSNRRRDRRRAKYRLEHIVRTHKGADDRSFRSIYQEVDMVGLKGLKMSKELLELGGDALKANITTLGPLVLPLSEHLIFLSTQACHLSGNKFNPPKPYIPDFKLAFQHLCIHAASNTVLDELQRNMELTDKNLEASRAVLHRFGNTASSSIWYALAYLEAKGHVEKGERIWQLAFGSGFKCNSAVWKSVRTMERPSKNPWLDCINRYP